MNLDKLYEILKETTSPFRKGPETLVDGKAISAEELKERFESGIGGVYTIFDMPPIEDANSDLVKVDCHFVVVGVDKKKAMNRLRELTDVLKEWPDGRLMQGPSYIETGATLGSQDAALQLYGLGEALGLWTVITPKKLGFTDVEADRMAGMGMVMIAPSPAFVHYLTQKVEVAS